MQSCGRPHKLREPIMCLPGGRWLGCAGWQAAAARPPTTGRRRAPRTCTPGCDRLPRPGSLRAARALAGCWREVRDASWRRPAPPASQARGSSTARGDPPTRNSAYSFLVGSATTANGMSACWARSSTSEDWNTTTSRMPAATSSWCRRATDRRCRLQKGQPAYRRNWRWTTPVGSGSRIRWDWVVTKSRVVMTAPGRSLCMIHLPLCCAAATGVLRARARKSSTMAV
jgi:hypothetical protein